MSNDRKVAVVTGASQGIGAGLVAAFRGRNYRVVATARSIKPSGDDDILVVPGDIADRKTAERVISEGLARFGRIDTLINNAGIFIAKLFTQYTEADYAAILGVKSPDSSISRSSPLPRWRSKAAVMSSRSPPASWTTRIPACRPCLHR
jgi:NAD(P)-dependent dehydrogenase (short-subunit alcohol dehydrogenase family)